MAGIDPELDALDTDTLVVLTSLWELERQSRFAVWHLDSARKELMNAVKKVRHSCTVRQAWESQESCCRELQAALTCAQIVDSMITGKGPPPPKSTGLEDMTDSQRERLRKELRLIPGFDIGARNLRNVFIHPEARLVKWSAPGNLRGSMLTSPTRIEDHPSLCQVLRAVSLNPFELLVLGERCSLDRIREALLTVQRSSKEAQERILRAENDAQSGLSSAATI